MRPVLVTLVLLSSATIALAASTVVGATLGTSTSLTQIAPRAAPNPASLLAPGLLWQHPCFEEALTPKCVAIGDETTLVSTDFEGSNTFVRTLSSSDHTPAQAVSQSATSYTRKQCVVRAADHVDVRADIAYAKTSLLAPTVPVLTRASFTDPAHDWSFAFPFSVTDVENAPLGLGVSRDGHTIVATAYQRAQGKQSVAVFASASPSPTVYVDFPVTFEPLRYAVSADGSTLFVLSLSYTLIVDTHTGLATYSAANFEYPTSGMAISGDGARFAKSYLSDHRIEVFQKSGGTYALSATYHPTSADAGQCYRLAFSDDGSTLAAGYWDVAFPGQVATVIVLDLSDTTPAVELEDRIVGNGPYWNLIQDVVMSRDGSTVAVGLTGSQSGTVPELVAYRRDAARGVWSRVLAAYLQGSVADLDLSGDGTKVAVACLRGHMEAPLGGGEVDLYRVIDQDLALDGVPHQGASVAFHYAPSNAVPGTHAALLTAPSLSVTPHTLPNIGTLYIDRASAHAVGSGTLDTSGEATFHLVLPGGAAAIGTVGYYQALTLSPRRLSETWIKLTVLP